MARVRRSFRLVLAGETILVETNAWDLVKAERDGQGSVQQGLRTAHMACVRLHLPVPPTFEAFCADLDDFTDITDGEESEEEGGGDLDPTQ